MVIVGGLTFGTVLTLFVVPTFYTLLARGARGGAAEPARPAAAEVPPPVSAGSGAPGS
jgi:multidrug efflux pump